MKNYYQYHEVIEFAGVILIGVIGFVMAYLELDTCYDRKEKNFKQGSYICNVFMTGVVLMLVCLMILYNMVLNIVERS